MIDLKRLQFEKGLNQNSLGDILRLQQPEISKMVNGRRDIKQEHIDLLIAHFGKETIDKYIIDDDLIALSNVPQARQVTATIISADVVDDIKEEMKAEEACKDGCSELEQTVVISAEVVHRPNYDIRDEFFKGTLDGRIKPTQSIVPAHDLKAYTENDEMSPEIGAGDSVLIRFLDDSPDKVVVFPGRMYFVDLPNGGVVRYVYEAEDGRLILRSTKPRKYPDVVVKRDEIISISLVVLILKRPNAMAEDLDLLPDVLARHDELFAKMLDQIDKAGERQDRLIEMIEKKL